MDGADHGELTSTCATPEQSFRTTKRIVNVTGIVRFIAADYAVSHARKYRNPPPEALP